MKRKTCLIECVDAVDSAGFEKRIRDSVCISETKVMAYKNTSWYKSILNAEKSCLKDDKIKKVHYKFQDEREMVEEYNVDTHVLLRRAWKIKGKLSGEGKWVVEVGDAITDVNPNNDSEDIKESKDQPVMTRRNTRVNLEWRIRNLPYPIETYSVKANNDTKQITVSTTNKKYFKKLEVPEFLRLNLPLQQANIQISHKFNTLIISYRKPQQFLDMEKEWYEELQKVKPITDIPSDCKTQ